MLMILMLLLHDRCDYGGSNLKGVHAIKHMRACDEEARPADDGARHARLTIGVVINSSLLRHASAETKLLAFSENITGPVPPRSPLYAPFRDQSPTLDPRFWTKVRLWNSNGTLSYPQAISRALNLWREQWPYRLSRH